MRGIFTAAVFAAFLFLSGCISTQLPDAYQVEPEVLEAKGEQVSFTVKGTIPEKSFHKKAVVEFTPYLSYDGKTKELKKFVLRGEKTEGEGTVINSKTGGSFTYNETFDYTDEMRMSELMVKAVVKKNGAEVSSGDYKLADGVIATFKNVMHDEKTIEAPSGYEKETIITEKANVYFRQNMSNINMYLDLNKSDKSKEAMQNVEDFLMKGWEIKDITIDAWASPEGEIDFNDNLAEDRAESVNKMMDKKLQKVYKAIAKERGVSVDEVEHEVKYMAKGNGEDWDGFMMAVKNSDLKDKSTIVNVVNSQNDVNKREQEIRNMTVIYKEVADAILPPLRRAEISVNCYEPKRTDEEIAQLATTHPDSLTYAELLHAATLTHDHQAKLNIYKAGFVHEGRDWKTYNNAGVEALQLDKNEEAENLLNQSAKLTKDNGILENNFGVLACRNEDYKKAEEYFMNARRLGEDVSYNLGVVMIQKGDYQKALTEFGKTDCDHNVALAQVLSGKMNEALKNLKCAPESPETFYLLAIYGARTNDANMVIEYLGKSFKLDPSMKAKAAEDREFVKFYDNDGFKALMK